MTSFFVEHWDVIGFYALVVILLYIFRSRFEFQGMIALLKTKLGLEFMTNTGKRHPRFWHTLGLISIVLCFIGMVFITGYLVFGLYNLIFVPDAPPTLSPVIPGVPIPGSPIDFPLWYTLIGLFFAVIIHEAAHGVWSAAYNIKIKSSGFAFFGPLPGAFVEPDEKAIVKRSARQQLAIFSAGPFANVILAIGAFILMILASLAFSPLLTTGGVEIQSVYDNSSAALAGIQEGMLVTAVDGAPTMNMSAFVAALANKTPGDPITLVADGREYSTTLKANPQNASRAQLGVDIEETLVAKNPSLSWLGFLLPAIVKAIYWVYLISISLGIANLLPIGPLDGGQMFRTILTKAKKNDRMIQFWLRWSLLLFAIIILLVLLPILTAVNIVTPAVKAFFHPLLLVLFIAMIAMALFVAFIPTVFARSTSKFWLITVVNVILVGAAVAVAFYVPHARVGIISLLLLVWGVLLVPTLKES